MRARRLSLTLAAMLLAGGLLAPGPRARAGGAAEGEACFAETGFCVQGRFLAYWQANGNLARNGFPLSEERRELLEDGKEYTVQYFERVRLEYHPENQPPYDVLLGQFGRRLIETESTGRFAEPSRPAPALAGQAYFPQTAHNLGGPFLAYWQEHGGLAQFGFPLTEEFGGVTVGLQGDASRVQYFERGRLEYHPEYAGTAYAILLGQFGRAIAEQNRLLAEDFRALYLTDAAVRAQLGEPRAGEGPAASGTVPGATQAFERGRMVYLERGLTTDASGGYVVGGTVYVLAGAATTGDWSRYPDTWQEGQEAGGGAAPIAGLFYPQRGFGKVWRENAPVQQGVGYALTGKEQALAIAVQYFARGQMLAVATPEGRFIYVLSLTEDRGGRNFQGRYERFAAGAR